MKRLLFFGICFLFVSVLHAQNVPTGVTLPVQVTAKPLPYYSEPSPYYMRSFVPVVPIQDTNLVNINTSVDSVFTATQYFDDLHRPIEKVVKQASPTKKDNVVVSWYDEFGRASTQYLPYVSQTGNTNDGKYKNNPFAADSAYYKSQFPNEQINYAQQVYDGSPLNRVTKTTAPGNSWTGSNVGVSYSWKANTDADSVIQWTIPTNSENDVPVKTGYYLTGSLSIQIMTDENGMSTFVYTDETGKTVLTKKQLQSVPTPSTGQYYGWLSTYYVYDEMNHLRMVLPPKATEQLLISNWVVTTATMQGLCYSYYYDNRGRQTAKRIPGKGILYTAYDLLDRPVMTQDPNLRTTSQWAFVLYDGQDRPIKSGVITSALSKDVILSQAAASNNYPSLSGAAYTVMKEIYYDDYNWVQTTGAPVSNTLNSNNVNSVNFITNYNAAPDYAQLLTQSMRIRGSVTGTKTFVLNSTSSYLYAVVFYDNNGKAIQTRQTNITNGTDEATVQYSFAGRLLRSHLTTTKAGINSQTHTILSKYNYDHAGRLLSLAKSIDGNADKTTVQYNYMESGQVLSKVIGSGIETQQYKYNIRGMLTAINNDYVSNPNATNAYFGEVISYDYGFTNNQANGSIAGVQWKTGGDKIARAYGYNYDNASRLTRADFTQQNNNATAWTNDKADFSVSGLSYDAGGNIMSMTQRGMLGVGSNATIDSLIYSYTPNTNRLKTVADLAPSSGAGGSLGDFKDSTNINDDYDYDANGNTVKDLNRHLYTGASGNGAAFNLLDKPDSLAIAGKSCTYYQYDATGSMISKQVKNYTTGTIKNYVYVSGFVYLNDTLQYAMIEGGRVRPPLVSGNPWVFDYFIQDHAANVRAVLTDEVKQDNYPVATMDTTTAIKNTEEMFYSGLTATRVIKPAGYPIDTYDVSNTNDYVAKVQGNGNKIGPSITLKVMAGDTFNVRVSSYYNLNSTTPDAPSSPINDIVTALIGSVSNSAVLNTHGVTNTQLANNGSFTNVSDFLSNQANTNYNAAKPKAYLNWILFDEQFNYVSASSGAQQVGRDGMLTPITKQGMPISKSGYLYIYTSNETPNIPVYFDNLQVSHLRGKLLETSEYYPYGLGMKNISYKAAGSLQNRYKYNAGNEYEDEGELNYSNTFYRKYDAQIGRFTGVDPKAEATLSLTPYQFGNNNPVMFNDPLGDLLMADWNDFISRLNIGINNGGFGDFGGYYDGGSSGGGGGGLTLFNSNDQAFGWGVSHMNSFNNWGSQPGWATSFGQALGSYNGGHITAAMVQGYYQQQWQGTNRYNISTNESHGLREGQGFAVDFNFHSINQNEVVVGSLFLSNEKAFTLLGGNGDINRGLNGYDLVQKVTDVSIISTDATINATIGAQRLANSLSNTTSEIINLGERGLIKGLTVEGAGRLLGAASVSYNVIKLVERPTWGRALETAISAASLIPGWG